MRTAAATLPVLTHGARVVLAFRNWLQQEYVIADDTNFKCDPPTLSPKGAWGTIISKHGIGEVFDLPEAECNVISVRLLEVRPCVG